MEIALPAGRIASGHALARAVVGRSWTPDRTCCLCYGGLHGREPPRHSQPPSWARIIVLSSWMGSWSTCHRSGRSMRLRWMRSTGCWSGPLVTEPPYACRIQLSRVPRRNRGRTSPWSGTLARLPGRPPAAGRCFVLVEVADTSLELDRGATLVLYARAGIREFDCGSGDEQRIGSSSAARGQIRFGDEGPKFTACSRLKIWPAFRSGLIHSSFGAACNSP